MKFFGSNSKKFIVGALLFAALQFNVAHASDLKFTVIDDCFNPGITSVVIEGDTQDVNLELLKRKYGLIRAGILDSVSVSTNVDTNYTEACLEICEFPQKEVNFIETRFYEGELDKVDSILIDSSDWWEVCHYYAYKDNNDNSKAQLALIKAVQ